MIDCDQCMRGVIYCTPLSNVVSERMETFCCVGLLKKENRTILQDKYRHCFKSDVTDSIYDYDSYDLISTMKVMATALLYDELGVDN